MQWGWRFYLSSSSHSVPMRLCHFRLVIGAWLFVIGYWALELGHWSLPPSPSPNSPPLHSLLSSQQRCPLGSCAAERTAAMGDRVLRRSVHLGEGNRMPVGDEKRIVSKAL